MTTAEERIKILKKVSEGELSASEAAAMLSADPAGHIDVEVEEPEALKKEVAIEVEDIPQGKTTTGPAETNGKKATWLHVRVSDLNTGKRKVTVNIPLRLMKLGMRLGSAFAPELADIDIDELNTAFADEGRGVLVDVEDDEDGNHVQVYID